MAGFSGSGIRVCSECSLSASNLVVGMVLKYGALSFHRCNRILARML